MCKLSAMLKEDMAISTETVPAESQQHGLDLESSRPRRLSHGDALGAALPRS